MYVRGWSSCIRVLVCGTDVIVYLKAWQLYWGNKNVAPLDRDWGRASIFSCRGA